jgi:hypothetical protein
MAEDGGGKMSATCVPPGPQVKDYTANAFAPAPEALRGQLTEWPAVREFIFAGNARFTLRSIKTGMRYTYQVKAKKEELTAAREKPDIDVTYFISLLRGSDNQADYKYLGVLRKSGKFFITSASRLPRTSPSVKALVWFCEAMVAGKDVFGKGLEVWHEGRCCRCGRLLTVPESIARGMGEDCAGRS